MLSSHIPKGSTRLKIALRPAANAIGNLKETHLLDFFRLPMAFRKGRQAAVSATARKLAVIIWNMLSKGVQYQPPTQYLFLDEKSQSLIFCLRSAVMLKWNAVACLHRAASTFYIDSISLGQ